MLPKTLLVTSIVRKKNEQRWGEQTKLLPTEQNYSSTHLSYRTTCLQKTNRTGQNKQLGWDANLIPPRISRIGACGLVASICNLQSGMYRLICTWQVNRVLGVYQGSGLNSLGLFLYSIQKKSKTVTYSKATTHKFSR